MPEIVVLDTNAWLFGTRLLRSPLAVALLRLSSERGTVVLLPEVVEVELYAVLRRVIDRQREEVTRALNQVGSLLGRDVPLPALPSDDDVERVVRDRLEELSSVLRRVPLTLAHARSALARVVDQKPPADKTEEFRDSMIWEAVVAAGPLPTYFVTSDKAFYADRVYDKGLAPNLREHAHVVISPDLEMYLDAVGGTRPAPPMLDEKAVADAVDAATRIRLNDELVGSGQYLELLDRTDAQASLFFTDKPDILACKFELRYRAFYSPDGSEEPVRCRFLITGEALLPATLGPAISVDFDSSQIDDGPVVSWMEPAEFGNLRRFSELSERRVRLRT